VSKKWEAMGLVSALEPDRATDYFLLVCNDNDSIACRCRMAGQVCNSAIDNDNRLLVYRLTLPALLRQRCPAANSDVTARCGLLSRTKAPFPAPSGSLKPAVGSWPPNGVSWWKAEVA
jgi:hypothetical protein